MNIDRKKNSTFQGKMVCLHGLSLWRGKVSSFGGKGIEGFRGSTRKFITVDTDKIFACGFLHKLDTTLGHLCRIK